MGIFKAKFRKYWCDRYSEYTEIRTSNIDEILEYSTEPSAEVSPSVSIRRIERL